MLGRSTGMKDQFPAERNKEPSSLATGWLASPAGPLSPLPSLPVGNRNLNPRGAALIPLCLRPVWTALSLEALKTPLRQLLSHFRGEETGSVGTKPQVECHGYCVVRRNKPCIWLVCLFTVCLPSRIWAPPEQRSHPFVHTCTPHAWDPVDHVLSAQQGLWNESMNERDAPKPTSFTVLAASSARVHGTRVISVHP